MQCPAGSFCPTDTTTSPVTCPRGSYCAIGASSPTKCQALYDSDVGQPVSVSVVG